MAKDLKERKALMTPDGRLSEIIRTAYGAILRDEARNALTKDEMDAIGELCFVAALLRNLPISGELFDMAKAADRQRKREGAGDDDE